MISEKDLARHFSSFWRNLFPMSDRLTRHVNITYERYQRELELPIESPADRRGLINECAFELARRHWEQFRLEAVHIDWNIVELQTAIELHAIQKISTIEDIPVDAYPHLVANEWEEVILLSRSVITFLRRFRGGASISFSPMIMGCGLVARCFGDIYLDNTLIEVKAGERNFRAIDLRQIVVYAALNHVSMQYPIDQVIWLNPRRGVFFRSSLDDICVLAAGRSAADCLTDLVRFMSEAGVSK